MEKERNDGSYSLCSQCGKVFEEKQFAGAPGEEGILSDEGTLSFRQRRWFALREPLEFSASVITEALGGHYPEKEIEYNVHIIRHKNSNFKIQPDSDIE